MDALLSASLADVFCLHRDTRALSREKNESVVNQGLISRKKAQNIIAANYHGGKGGIEGLEGWKGCVKAERGGASKGNEVGLLYEPGRLVG